MRGWVEARHPQRRGQFRTEKASRLLCIQTIFDPRRARACFPSRRRGILLSHPKGDCALRADEAASADDAREIVLTRVLLALSTIASVAALWRVVEIGLELVHAGDAWGASSQVIFALAFACAGLWRGGVPRRTSGIPRSAAGGREGAGAGHPLRRRPAPDCRPRAFVQGRSGRRAADTALRCAAAGAAPTRRAADRRPAESGDARRGGGARRDAVATPNAARRARRSCEALREGSRRLRSAARAVGAATRARTRQRSPRIGAMPQAGSKARSRATRRRIMPTACSSTGSSSRAEARISNARESSIASPHPKGFRRRPRLATTAASRCCSASRSRASNANATRTCRTSPTRR